MEDTEPDSLTDVYRSVPRHLLDRESPQTDDWERVLVTVAAHSSQWRTPSVAVEASRCAVDELA